MSSLTRLRGALHTTWAEIRGGLPETRGFLYFQRFKRQQRYDVPSAPLFDPEGLAYFSELVAGSSVYLEYGSGGSTVLAARHVDHLISVDNDDDFLACVARRVQGSPAATQLIYADTGIIRDYGEPLLKAPTRRRLRRWRHYATVPWERAEAAGLRPDLVLIDGRFRVACALMSLLKMADATRLLFDDYVDRRERYSTVEQFADVVAVKGRMAVLRRRADIDLQACAAAFEQMVGDFR